MKSNTRFIASILKSSKETQVMMPWSRGTRRAALIAKRKAPLPTRQAA